MGRLNTSFLIMLIIATTLSGCGIAEQRRMNRFGPAQGLTLEQEIILDQERGHEDWGTRSLREDWRNNEDQWKFFYEAAYIRAFRKAKSEGAIIVSSDDHVTLDKALV